MQKTILILIAAILASCVSHPVAKVSRDELQRNADEASRSLAMCAAKAVIELDDMVSDAQSVALAASSQCTMEYSQQTAAYSALTLDNDAQRQMFRQRREYPISKVQMFIPFVLQHRAMVHKQSSSTQ